MQIDQNYWNINTFIDATNLFRMKRQNAANVRNIAGLAMRAHTINHITNREDQLRLITAPSILSLSFCARVSRQL